MHLPTYIMCKPAGAMCNMACEYCYYLSKKDLYPQQKRTYMSDETLEAFTKAYMGNYDSGTIRIDETVDEDGVTLQIFTDMRGLKVMERRGVKGSRLDTIFVYDDYGQLRYVLPPQMSNSSIKRTDTDAQKYAFWYDYDFAGNVTLARIPGCEPVRFSYNNQWFG